MRRRARNVGNRRNQLRETNICVAASRVIASSELPPEKRVHRYFFCLKSLMVYSHSLSLEPGQGQRLGLIMQKLFTLAVSEARAGHLKAIEI